MLYIAFLVIIYLVIGNYLLNTFIQLPLFLLLTSGNHKYDLFFYETVYFFEVQLNHSTMLVTEA